MIDANTHQFCPFMIGLLSSILLPLFVVALLSAMTGGTSIVGTALSEALELFMTLVIELLQRLFKLAFFSLWFLMRLAGKAIVVLSAMGVDKFKK